MQISIQFIPGQVVLQSRQLSLQGSHFKVVLTVLQHGKNLSFLNLFTMFYFDFRQNAWLLCVDSLSAR